MGFFDFLKKMVSSDNSATDTAGIEIFATLFSR
jgi:PTS system glucose-specific IIA component